MTDTELRASFVNCSRTAAGRIRPPETPPPWADLDYLGWFDPRAPLAGHLVVPTAQHGPVGLVLRPAGTGVGQRRARMCSLCHTVHHGQGVALMVAPRAGRAGRDGNTVGVDICAALDCSLLLRGLVPPPALAVTHETLGVPEKVERLERHLLTFVERVLRTR